MHNIEKLADWFVLYEEIVKIYKIEQENIYNMNEKGFVMKLQRKLRIICFKHHRSLMTSDDNREWVSLIKCVNILSEVLKMWIIFKGKLQQKSWMKVINDDHIIISENEWINNEIGFIWLERCFEPETRRRVKEGISHMNRVTKAFMRLDSIIFTDSKKRSSKKRVNNGLSSESHVLRPSSFIQPSFIESLLPVSSVSLRQQRKRASKPIKALKQQSLAPSQSTRSGRLIRPRNLDLWICICIFDEFRDNFWLEELSCRRVTSSQIC